MRKITHIVIHHNGIPGRDIEDIRRTHVDGNGWDDVGYHAIILEDGTVQYGRPVERPGAHLYGGNVHTLGACVIGNLNKTPMTDNQLDALVELVNEWRARFDVPVENVVGHREWAKVPGAKKTDKECPGTRVDMDHIRLLLTAHEPETPTLPCPPPDPVPINQKLDRDKVQEVLHNLRVDVYFSVGTQEACNRVKEAMVELGLET